MEKDYGVGLRLHGGFCQKSQNYTQKTNYYYIWRYLLWQAVLDLMYSAQKKRRN